MELLAPAGTFRKLQYAVEWGACAVYAGGQEFGMRARAGNLSDREIEQAVAFCHARQKKLYITLNIFPRNRRFDDIRHWLDFLSQAGVDGVIVSDPGVFTLVRKTCPDMRIHISTQANVLNWRSAAFWRDLGVRRVILARECTWDEIREIRQRVPGLELEMFVHGAMCVAWSGRCLLSAFLAGRSANDGNCAQTCRWRFTLHEEKRPGQAFDIEEDAEGTYIMNSRDLCLMDRLPEILDGSVDSLKIEGRMKGLHYLATVTRAYRTAIDRLQAGLPIGPDLRRELERTSHRPYWEGFFDGDDSAGGQYTGEARYFRTRRFLGEVVSAENGRAVVHVRDRFEEGQLVELIQPRWGSDMTFKVEGLTDQEGQRLDFARSSTQVVMDMPEGISPWALLREGNDSDPERY